MIMIPDNLRSTPLLSTWTEHFFGARNLSDQRIANLQNADIELDSSARQACMVVNMAHGRDQNCCCDGCLRAPGVQS